MAHVNELGQFVLLTPEVFSHLYGSGWDKARLGKRRVHVDFSSDKFNLETLDGPEGGLLQPRFECSHIEVLNLSRNQLIDVECLNRFTDGRPDFLRLRTLNASHNQLTRVRLIATMLADVDLSHNELRELPDVASLMDLHRLILSHNRIDGTLERLTPNRKLRQLDISTNLFSWRPSVFKQQVDTLKLFHLEHLRLAHNPFTKHFAEYQVLALGELTALTQLDDKRICRETRKEIYSQAGKWRGKVDYGALDIEVEERAKQNELLQRPGDAMPFPAGAEVPHLSDLTGALDRALDHPDKSSKHIHELEQQARLVWVARPEDRDRLTERCKAVGIGQLRRSGSGTAGGSAPLERWLTADEEAAEVAEFATRVQQALNRFDTCQEPLVASLVLLLASGNAALSHRCASLLGDWLDGLPREAHMQLRDLSSSPFKDIIRRVIPGVMSASEPPFACFEASCGSQARLKALVGGGAWADAASVAETAGIFGALGRGLGAAPSLATALSPWVREVSPSRAAALWPLVPLLCRESRGRLGPPQPAERWAEHRNADAFPGEDAETTEMQATELEIARSRCVRRGFGGFVASEVQRGMLRVSFKAHDPEVLAGARRTSSAGSVLYVRPSPPAPWQEAARRGKSGAGEAGYEAWDAWVAGMELLRLATTDAYIAAACVELYGLHEVLVQHDADKENGWAEAWLESELDASRAFVVAAQVAENLTNAHGDAALQAASYFVQHQLHVRCWDRVRSRFGLSPGRSPLSVESLNGQSPEFATVVDALLGVVRGVLRRASGDIGEGAVADLVRTGLDVFETMLHVAAHADETDPLLLAASLELIHVFLERSESRHLVVEKVLDLLQDGASLIPYIRGPTLEDGRQNKRYQDIWRQCEVKYPASVSSRERFPELWHDGAGGQDDRGTWRRRVPELRDLRHPLMHRVLLAVLRLFGLFSEKAQLDPALRRAAEFLDSAGRETLLIGPANGLATCSSIDVRIESLRCVANVLRCSPEQCQVEELCRVTRFLTAVGIGVGRQDELLIVVLELVSLLVQDKAAAGRAFRAEFAKGAIRESFEVLLATLRLDGHTKRPLILKVVEFMAVCSSTRSGELRAFLRRADLLSIMREALRLDDERGTDCNEALLRTWPGRCVRDVLFPLVCGSFVGEASPGRLLGLVRLADVLQGKLDYRAEDLANPSATTHEADVWPSLARMQKALDVHDPLDDEDWKEQQHEFIARDGLQSVLGAVRRFCMATGIVSQADFDKQQVRLAVADAGSSGATGGGEASADSVGAPRLPSPPSARGGALARRDTGPSAAAVSAPRTAADAAPSEAERCFLARLRAANSRVSSLFNYNLNVFDEQSNSSSLAKLAHAMAIHFQENHRRHKAQFRAEPDAYRELLAMQNFYFAGGELVSEEQMQRLRLEPSPVRQPGWHLERLLDGARVAQRRLKHLLIAGAVAGASAGPTADALAWANAVVDEETTGAGNGRPLRLSSGLANFLRDHGAEVVDPGVMTRREVEHLLRFKLRGDVSRLRNLSRLMILFPSVKDLLGSVKDLSIGAANRLGLLRIRNKFAVPSSFGDRLVVVSVELALETGPHVCELLLSIGDVARIDPLQRRLALVAKLRSRLVDSCRVREADAASVADVLEAEVASRSLRHGDIVMLRCSDMHLQVDEDAGGPEARNVSFARCPAPNTANLFRLDREGGDGVVRHGDIVMLRSRANNRHLELGATNQAQCRGVGELEGADAEEREAARFVIEHADGADDGVRRPPKNVRSGMQVRLCSCSSKRYLTAVAAGTAGRTYIGSMGERFRVKGQVREPGVERLQDFAIFREGSMQELLRLEGSSATSAPAAATSDERTMRTLLEAHMCSEGRFGLAAEAEGDASAATPTLFRSIAARQARIGVVRQPKKQPPPRRRRPPPGVVPSGGRLTEEDRSRAAASLPLFVSAALRCVHALLELPRAPLARRYALDALLFSLPPGAGKGGRGADGAPALQQLLSLALCCHRMLLKAGGSVDSNGAAADAGLLPAKVLRVLTAVLSRAAAPVEDASPRRGRGAEDVPAVPDAQGRAKHLFAFLGVASAYIVEAVVPLVHERVTAAVCTPLGLGDVVLVKELAAFADAAALALFSSEASSQAAQPPAAQRAGIFRDLLPKQTIGVLVRSLLYGIHREALAFGATVAPSRAAGAAPSRAPRGAAAEVAGAVPVRALTSLVDRVSVALAAAAHGHGSVEDPEGCQYEVCEAISQAMTSGSHHVPRARVAELMCGRATEGLRERLQEILVREAFAAQDAEAASPAKQDFGNRPAVDERITAICRGWLMEIDGGGGGSQPPAGLFRVVVAMTSRSHLLVAELQPPTADAGPEGESGCGEVLDWIDEEEFTLRQLGRLRRIITCRRMPQFLGLLWDDADGRIRKEVILFESSARRRAFFQALRAVVPAVETQAELARMHPRQPWGGALDEEGEAGVPRQRGSSTAAASCGAALPVSEVGAEVMEALQAAVRKDRGPNAGIVDVTLAWSRPGGARGRSDVSAAAGTFAAATGIAGQASAPSDLEVLVLTTDTLTVISCRSFFQQLAWADDGAAAEASAVDVWTGDADGESTDACAGAAGAGPSAAWLQDSDSEDDVLPVAKREPHAPADWVEQLEVVRDGPWRLGTLEGVWFLAETESKVRLQFATATEQFQFTSESERQRWRRRLALVLDADSGGHRGGLTKGGGSGGGSAWAVLPTDKATLEEARRAQRQAVMR